MILFQNISFIKEVLESIFYFPGYLARLYRGLAVVSSEQLHKAFL